MCCLAPPRSSPRRRCPCKNSTIQHGSIVPPCGLGKTGAAVVLRRPLDDPLEGQRRELEGLVVLLLLLRHPVGVGLGSRSSHSDIISAISISSFQSSSVSSGRRTACHPVGHFQLRWSSFVMRSVLLFGSDFLGEQGFSLHLIYGVTRHQNQSALACRCCAKNHAGGD